MKRTLPLMIAVILALSLTACGGEGTQNQQETPPPPVSSDPIPPSAPESEGPAGTEDLQSGEPEPDAGDESGDPIVNTATLEDFETHPGDSEHMNPITEDYFYYQTTHTLDDVVLYQRIHSYDEQGNCCGDASKTVYASEEAAKSEYDKPMYDAIRSNITLDGAVLYQANEIGCGNRKLDDLEEFHWWQKYGSDTEKEFFSKPDAESLLADRQYIGEYVSGENTLSITADTITLVFDGVEYRAGYTTDQIDTSGGISAFTFHAGGSEIFVGVGTDFSVAEVYIDYKKGAAFTRSAGATNAPSNQASSDASFSAMAGSYKGGYSTLTIKADGTFTLAHSSSAFKETLTGTLPAGLKSGDIVSCGNYTIKFSFPEDSSAVSTDIKDKGGTPVGSDDLVRQS